MKKGEFHKALIVLPPLQAFLDFVLIMISYCIVLAASGRGDTACKGY